MQSTEFPDFEKLLNTCEQAYGKQTYVKKTRLFINQYVQEQVPGIHLMYLSKQDEFSEGSKLGTVALNRKQ